MKRITSAHNEPLKHLARLLSQARARREHGQTVLEGVHLVQTCLQHGLMPQQVYLPESRLHQPVLQTGLHKMHAFEHGLAVFAARARLREQPRQMLERLVVGRGNPFHGGIIS